MKISASGTFASVFKMSRHFFSLIGAVSSGAFFALPFAGVVGRGASFSFSLPFADERATTAGSGTGDGLGGFSRDLCPDTPFLDGAGGSTCLGAGVAGGGTGVDDELGALVRSFFAGVASARISSSVGSGTFRLPITSLGTSFAFSAGGAGGGAGFSRSRSFEPELDPCLRPCFFSRSMAMTSSRRSREPSSSNVGTGAGAGIRVGGGTSDSLGSLGFLPFGFGAGLEAAGDGECVPLVGPPPILSLITGTDDVGAGVVAGDDFDGAGVVAGAENLIEGVDWATGAGLS